MAVEHDASNGTKNAAVSSLTVSSFTVGNNPNRVLLAFVGLADTSPPTINSVVFNGSENFTLVGTFSGGTRPATIEVWRLVNPTATTANVVATFSASADNATLAVSSYYNVDQTTPIGETASLSFGSTNETCVAVDPGNGSTAPTGSRAVAGILSVDVIGATDYTLVSNTSAFPLFYATGTASQTAAATTITPALPAALRMGDIIFASLATENNNTHSTATSGWNSLVQTNSGATWRHSIWWALYDGTTAAPVFTWTGSVSASARCWHYRRGYTEGTPVATLGTVGTGTGATHSSTGGNTTQNNVVAQYIDHANANTALGAPGGSWTERFDAGSNTGPYRLVAGDQDITTSGSGSGNLSMSGATAAWVQQQLEIFPVGQQPTERFTTGGSLALYHTAVADMPGLKFNQFIWSTPDIANIDNNVMFAVTLLAAADDMPFAIYQSDDGMAVFDTAVNEYQVGSDTFAVGNPDVVVIEEQPYASFPEEIETDTSWSNWSWAQAPPIDDFPEDFILGRGTETDEQDFTDSADYSSALDPLPDDFPEDQLLGQHEPEQDYTDHADYGYTLAPLSDDFNEEFIPSTDGTGLDSQDFTDTADYGDREDPLSEDFPEDFFYASVSEPEQDYTDHADYGFAQAAGFEQDPQLGQEDSDSQDWTDRADYGVQVDPLPADFPQDQLLGQHEPEQDYTDHADYGSSGSVPDDDAQQDLVPSVISLDDQDFTDSADYGFSADPLPDDFPEDFAYASVSEPEQDYTDHTDYGSTSIAGEEQDQLLGDGSGLDDQDFTDTADYSFTLDPLSDTSFEDQLLGQHEPEQDYTDHSEYGWFSEPANFADISVPVNGGNVIIDIGCFHVINWSDIQDVVAVWSEIADSAESWAPIADTSTTWSDIADASASWSTISPPSTIWTEDC